MVFLKYPLPLVEQDLKMQMEILFLTFLNTDQNAPNFFKNFFLDHFDQYLKQ